MKKRKDKNLAEGEVTGHAHRCLGDCAVYDLPNGSRLLDAPDGVEVTHEEHKTIVLPAGRYNAIIAREVDPFDEEVRAVAD